MTTPTVSTAKTDPFKPTKNAGPTPSFGPVDKPPAKEPKATKKAEAASSAEKKTKVCALCKKEKALSDFPMSSRDGKKVPRFACKPCYRDYLQKKAAEKKKKGKKKAAKKAKSAKSSAKPKKKVAKKAKKKVARKAKAKAKPRKKAAKTPHKANGYFGQELAAAKNELGSLRSAKSDIDRKIRKLEKRIGGIGVLRAKAADLGMTV